METEVSRLTPETTPTTSSIGRADQRLDLGRRSAGQLRLDRQAGVGEIRQQVDRQPRPKAATMPNSMSATAHIEMVTRRRREKATIPMLFTPETGWSRGLRCSGWTRAWASDLSSGRILIFEPSFEAALTGDDDLLAGLEAGEDLDASRFPRGRCATVSLLRDVVR